MVQPQYISPELYCSMEGHCDADVSIMHYIQYAHKYSLCDVVCYVCASFRQRLDIVLAYFV